MDYSKILISQEQENKIKSKSPDKIPLNPTAQGWTGQQVRMMLGKALVDKDGSLLSEFKNKMSQVKEFLEIHGEDIEYLKTQYKDENFEMHVGEEVPESVDIWVDTSETIEGTEQQTIMMSNYNNVVGDEKQVEEPNNIVLVDEEIVDLTIPKIVEEPKEQNEENVLSQEQGEEIVLLQEQGEEIVLLQERKEEIIDLTIKK